MNSQKANRSSRLILSVILFATALTAAFTFSVLNNRTSSYWKITRPIFPGTIITSQDVEVTSAFLGDSSSLYLNSQSQVEGLMAKYSLKDGEFIPIGSVNNRASGSVESQFELVPISVRSADIPINAKAGDEINIFWVPEQTPNSPILKPEEILRGIHLKSIDRKGSNFGNDLALTISINSTDILKLLKATSSGRLVVVQSFE